MSLVASTTRPAGETKIHIYEDAPEPSLPQVVQNSDNVAVLSAAEMDAQPLQQECLDAPSFKEATAGQIIDVLARQKKKNARAVVRWCLDRDALVCFCCRVEFSTLQRRHHCRACGGVFCAQCSRWRTLLPHLGYDSPARVCEMCHEEQHEIAHQQQAEVAVAVSELNGPHSRSHRAPLRQLSANTSSSTLFHTMDGRSRS